MNKQDLKTVGTGKLALFGVAIICAFFGFFIAWSVMAPLSSAAIVQGVAKVQGERKTVQHLSGGIVRQIHINEGTVVEAGDPLLVLEDAEVMANVKVLRARRVGLATELARRDAERLDLEEVTYPDWLNSVENRDLALTAMKEHRVLFDNRLRDLRSSEDIIRLRVRQILDEIEGLKGRVEADTKQIELLRERLGMMNNLAKQGLVHAEQVFDLRQAEAQLEGAISENNAAIAGARGRILELTSERTKLRVERRSEASERYAILVTELAEVATELSGAEVNLTRRTLRAPIGGVVQGLKIHTEGGVILPGAPILDIVPQESDVIIDARLMPKDRDSVQVGALAEIRFRASGQRRAPPVSGKLVSVSADRMSDPLTLEDYFLARITFDQDSETLPEGLDIFPGMQASVAIVTGKRTVLGYLTEPLVQSFWRSLREK